MKNKSLPKTSKRSKVYRKLNTDDDTTPMGSQLWSLCVFYTHIIPSGLEIEIQNNLKELGYE